MLESQALWGLQSRLHPDALKAVADLELHVAQDRERDEALRGMTDKVSVLERRLQALELALGDRVMLGGAMRLAPQARPAQFGEPTIRAITARPKPARKGLKVVKDGRINQRKKAATLPKGARYADAKR